MNKVIACIDGTEVSTAVCDYAGWASLRLDAPLVFLHVLEKDEFPQKSNLSGSIGLGSREALLEELAELDAKRGKLALEQGKLMLEAAEKRAIADGLGNATSLQRHGSLVETLAEMEQLVLDTIGEVLVRGEVGAVLEGEDGDPWQLVQDRREAFDFTADRLVFGSDGSGLTTNQREGYPSNHQHRRHND